MSLSGIKTKVWRDRSQEQNGEMMMIADAVKTYDLGMRWCNEFKPQ